MKEIKCDYCGKVIKENQGILLVKFSHGSKYDMCHVEIDICDDCFEEKFPDIKNKIIKNYDLKQGGEGNNAWNRASK